MPRSGRKRGKPKSSWPEARRAMFRALGKNPNRRSGSVARKKAESTQGSGIRRKHKTSLAQQGIQNPSRFQRTGKPIVTRTTQTVSGTKMVARQVYDPNVDRGRGGYVYREFPVETTIQRVTGLETEWNVKRLHSRGGGGMQKKAPTAEKARARKTARNAAKAGKRGQRPGREARKQPKKKS